MHIYACFVSPVLTEAQRSDCLALPAVVVEAGAEGGLSEPQHHFGVGREDSEWGRGTTKGVLPEVIEVWASLLPVF